MEQTFSRDLQEISLESRSKHPRKGKRATSPGPTDWRLINNLLKQLPQGAEDWANEGPRGTYDLRQRLTLADMGDKWRFQASWEDLRAELVARKLRFYENEKEIYRLVLLCLERIARDDKAERGNHFELICEGLGTTEGTGLVMLNTVNKYLTILATLGKVLGPRASELPLRVSLFGTASRITWAGIEALQKGEILEKIFRPNYESSEYLDNLSIPIIIWELIGKRTNVHSICHFLHIDCAHDTREDIKADRVLSLG